MTSSPPPTRATALRLHKALAPIWAPDPGLAPLVHDQQQQ